MEKPIKSKVLLKNIQRSSIPVLERVYVSNGIATTTDMDVWIKTTTTLNDGLYYKEGILAGLYIEDKNSKMIDFPDLELERLGDALDEITFDAVGIKSLEFVSRTMSNEITRYYFCGICFNKNHMVATNGHMLHMVNIKCNLDENIIIPSKAINTILALFKETKANCASITFYKNYICANVGGITLISKVMDGTYPDYMCVIPNDFEKTGEIDVHEMIAIKPKVTAIAKINGSNHPAVRFLDKKITVNDDFIKTGIYWDTTIDIDAGFRINYLTQMCSGTYGYKDKESPFLVKGNDFEGQISVLMPLRVY